MTISERLFALLYERRISQKEFSERTGINSRTVSAWQTRGSDPPARLIPKIAAFLNVSVMWLLTGEDGPDVGASPAASAGGARGLSKEERELLRLYGEMSVRDRLKLLSAAYDLGEGPDGGRG